MGILAIYDVTGIQEYIFSSNKLKENLGASVIVQEVLEDYLVKAIQKVDGKIEIDWKNNKRFLIKSDNSINSEIIYIGGGNVMVAYKNKDTYLEVNKALSRKTLEETGGMLRFAVACIKSEFKSFYNDKQRLFQELNKNKSEMLQTVPLLGISITREGVTDGLPAQKRDNEDNSYISLPAWLKRNKSKKSFYEGRLIPAEYQNKYVFPKEFDDMGQVEGENYIAVVHIDGNSMGQLIEDLTKGEESYEKAVQNMRSLSNKISIYYKEVMGEVVNSIIESIEKEILQLAIKKEDGKSIIPLRPIVLNGDDVTFVCNGRLGISCAEIFLTEIGKRNIHVEEKEISLSACAGVTIVKSHFPFYRAYQLSEELCQSAKIKGKVIFKESAKPMASWLDYHIVFSGITSELAEMRKAQYNVPGMTKLKSLEIEEYRKVIMESPRYHLLWRPWCVAGEVNDEMKWEELKDILREFTSRKPDGNLKWPRSKLKTLRSQFMKSKEDVESYIKELKSRGLDLPVFNGKGQEVFKEVSSSDQLQTPYFDAIELLDLYLPIREEEE